METEKPAKRFECGTALIGFGATLVTVIWIFACGFLVVGSSRMMVVWWFFVCGSMAISFLQSRLFLASSGSQMVARLSRFKWKLVAPLVSSIGFWFGRDIYGYGFNLRLGDPVRQKVIVEWADSVFERPANPPRAIGDDMVSIEPIPADVRQALGGAAVRCVVYVSPEDAFPILRLFVPIGFGRMVVTVLPVGGLIPANSDSFGKVIEPQRVQIHYDLR
jgi:hypothetical protein